MATGARMAARGVRKVAYRATRGVGSTWSETAPVSRRMHVTEPRVILSDAHELVQPMSYPETRGGHRRRV